MTWRRGTRGRRERGDRDPKLHRAREEKPEDADDLDEILDPEDSVELPVADELDLHTFDPKEVASVVEAYLEEAQRKGFTRVRLIHGRGTGTQREIVRSVLSRSPLVVSFNDATPERGGWGATMVELAAADASPPED